MQVSKELGIISCVLLILLEKKLSATLNRPVKSRRLKATKAWRERQAPAISLLRPTHTLLVTTATHAISPRKQPLLTTGV